MFHVDPVAGSDSRTGIGTFYGDFSQAVLTLRQAVTLLNATAAPGIILIKADSNPVFTRTQSGASSSLWPTQPCSIQAIGGKATITAADAHTWVRDTTYPNLFRATESNYAGGLDLLNKQPIRNDAGILTDRDGKARMVPTELTVFSTPALLSAAVFDGTRGGGCVNTGGVTYVRRADGADVTDANTRIFRSAVAYQLPQTAHLSGINFEGGLSSATAGTRNLWLDNCYASYGNMLNQGRGVWVDFSGVALFTQVESWANGSDGFNIHGVNGVCHAALFNCLCWDTGRNGTVSSNGLTSHEVTNVVDVNGDYQYGRGGTAAFIDSSAVALFGTRIMHDAGDSQFAPTSIRCSSNTRMWLTDVLAYSSNLALRSDAVTYAKSFEADAGLVTGTVLRV